MLGTTFVGVSGGLAFILMTILCYPVIFFLSEEKQKRFTRNRLKEISRFMLWLMQTKVEVIYVNKTAINRLDRKKGIVVVGNHQSNMDIPIIMGNFPLDLGFVAKQEMASWPIYSFWMKKSNCIFLNRSNPREGIKSIKKAVSIIKKGYPTVIFPEGERSLDGEIKEFKKGSFRLVTDTNGIVVPITIKGAYDIQSRGSLKINFRRKVKFIIGEPFSVEEISKEERKTLSNKVKNIVESNYGRY